MYFPKNFRLSEAVELAGLVQLAYQQRRAAQDGGTWSLPTELTLVAELSLPTKLTVPANLNLPGKLRLPAKLNRTGTEPVGFIARAGGTAYVVFRGTETPEEWIQNLKIRLVPYEGYGQVHAGFLENYWAFDESLRAGVQACGANAIVCVGHSLGASYATFAAIEIERKLKKKVKALYTFASPRIGDGEFAEAFNRGFEHRSFRVVNTSDIVPSLPPPCPVFKFGGYFSHTDTPIDFTVQLGGIRENHRIDTYRAQLAASQQKRRWFPLT